MKTHHLGFTLVDLLISLTIMAILVGAGIPGLQGFVANNQVDNGYRQLFTLLQFARSQSVFYRAQVVVCPSINEKDCIKNWQEQVIVFVDVNKNRTFDEGDTLLQTHEKIENDKEKRIVSAFPTTRHLSFNYNGSTGSQNGRMTYCVSNGEKTYARQIIIARTGRLRKGEESHALEKCSA